MQRAVDSWLLGVEVMGQIERPSFHTYILPCAITGMLCQLSDARYYHVSISMALRGFESAIYALPYLRKGWFDGLLWWIPIQVLDALL